MDRVFATRTVKGIKIALASMPQKIDELYKLTLERIQQQAGDDGMLAMRILSWITHARRPLTVNELQHGLAVEHNDDEDNDLNAPELDTDNLLQPESLVDVCAGLVIIDPMSQIIRLVHYTTQEYFSNKRLDLFTGTEADISRACLTYLSYDIGHRDPLELQAIAAFPSHPFLDYACCHWFSHANSSLSTENLAPVFLNFVARFKCSDSCLRSISLLRWHSQFEFNLYQGCPVPDEECPDQESALECASFWGLEELVTVLLDHSTGSFPGLDTSLFFASQSGAVNVVDLLLRYGAQVNAPVDGEGSSSKANTALSVACKGGHLPVVKVLMENGASPYVGDKPAMHAAALMDRPVVVNSLIKEGVNVNARNSKKKTALHYAASYASVEVIQLLLDAHCDLELQDRNGCTAMQLALSSRRVGIVKKLLDAHCDPNLKDNDGRTALHYAVHKDNVDAVKWLLDAHCDLNLKDNDGRTALHYAVHNGYEVRYPYRTSKGNAGVAKLLLDAHCDPNLKDKNGWTALHSAARIDALNAIEVLLDKGADVSAKDRKVLKRHNLPGINYRHWSAEQKTEQLIQRMIQLEQTSSAPPANRN